MQVTLHVYDLSGGLAKQLSQGFLGKQIDGIWHTGVVVFGKEWFYGGGIQSGPPGRTPYGVPVERIQLGETQIPEDVFMEFLQDLSPRFAMDKYDLLDNNCNDFSNEASVFLTGNGIPEKVSGLPGEVLNSPLGPMLRQMISRFQQSAMDAGWDGAGPPPLNPLVEAHPHRKLSLPLLEQYSKPFLLTQRGDGGQGAIVQLKSLQAAAYRDKGAVPPQEEVAALDQLASYLAQDPSNPTEPLPKACYRFMARVLAEWPLKSWGPALDIFRLLLLYQPVSRHYANSAGNPVPIIVKRCLSRSDDVPRAVKLRALFAVTNAFAHADGTRAALPHAAMLTRVRAAVRMSAAAVLYNVALQLPKNASVEVVQIASGLGHMLSEEKDKDTAFRMLLGLGKLAYCNTEAVQLLQTLALQINTDEWGG